MQLLSLVKKLSSLLWYLLILFSLVACGEKNVSDLTSFIDTVMARPKTPIEPLPEREVVESYIFDPEGLRDPFSPIDVLGYDPSDDMAADSGIRPDITRRKEELESYSLDTLRMVGTMTIESLMWGLVKASDGTIHRVHENNYLGRNNGKIIRITNDNIELMEIVPGSQKGLWREEQASLALTE